MPFMTYIAPGDVLTLECELTKVKLRVIKARGQKIRLAIEAHEDVKITKGEPKKEKKR